MSFKYDTKPVAVTPARDDPSASIGAQAAHFVIHLVQMCAVMCLSLVLLGLLAAGAGALLGFTDPRQSAPVLFAFLVTLTLSGSMVAWMRFMAMPWRPTFEMAGSTLLAVPSQQVGHSRLIGGSPPSALWRRRVL